MSSSLNAQSSSTRQSTPPPQRTMTNPDSSSHPPSTPPQPTTPTTAASFVTALNDDDDNIHTDQAHFQLQRAPSKPDGGRGFNVADDRIAPETPSTSAEKLARKKGKKQRQGKNRRRKKKAGADGAQDADSPASASVQTATNAQYQTPTPSPSKQRGTASSRRSRRSDRASPKTIAHAPMSAPLIYVAPHRRRSIAAPALDPLSPESRTAALPSQEDHFYTSSAGAALQRVMQSTPRTSPADRPSSSTRGKSPRATGSFMQDVFPLSPAPPAAIISHRPYEDPANYAHPSAILEDSCELDADDDSNSATSWADQVEEWERTQQSGDGTYPTSDLAHRRDSVESCRSAASLLRKYSLAPGGYGLGLGDDLEFLVRIGGSRRASSYGLAIEHGGIDVPSPVMEEALDEQQLRAMATAVRAHEEGLEHVCTGCGAAPTPAFVALTPCDHLACHDCLNSLINGTAHKPPRPVNCFCCGDDVASFVPAWLVIGAAFGGRISLIDALKDTLGIQSDATPLEVQDRSRKSPRHRRKALQAKSSNVMSDARAGNATKAGRDRVPAVGQENATNENGSPRKSKEKKGRRTSASSSAQPWASLGSGVISSSTVTQAQPTGSAQKTTQLLSPIALKTGYRHRAQSSASSTTAASPIAGKRPSGSANTTRSSPNYSFPRSGSVQHLALSAQQDENERFGDEDDADEDDTRTPDLSLSFTPMRSFADEEHIDRSMDEEGLQSPDSNVLSTPQVTMDDGGDAELRVETGSTSRKVSGVEAGHIGLSPGFAAQTIRQYSKFASTSPVPVVVRPAISWPVVRLDNIPWDVTVNEVEQWLPADSLAPLESCVMAVHILCNRIDGRTLNQCYLEAADVAAARLIVRTRDGQKLRHRPVHVTLSSQTELMNTLFPTYEPGFSGLSVNRPPAPCPLLLQTELTGLLSLCRLESPHAEKAKERAYYNIMSILQKFPWSQPHAWNSQQVIRLLNTCCVAVEILAAVRDHVPEWQAILANLIAAVRQCPGFRPNQKAKFFEAANMQRSSYVDPTQISPKPFITSVAHNAYVTVSGTLSPRSSLPVASFDVDLEDGATTSAFSSPGRVIHSHQAQHPYRVASGAAASTYDLSQTIDAMSPSATKHRRRTSSIARELGIDQSLVEAVASQLGCAVASQ